MQTTMESTSEEVKQINTKTYDFLKRYEHHKLYPYSRAITRKHYGILITLIKDMKKYPEKFKQEIKELSELKSKVRYHIEDPTEF